MPPGRSAEKRHDRFAFTRNSERPFAGADLDVVDGEAEGGGDGDVEVRDGDGVLLDFFRTFAGAAVGLATAGEDAGEGLRIVIATFVLVDERGASKLGGDDDEGFVRRPRSFKSSNNRRIKVPRLFDAPSARYSRRSSGVGILPARSR